MRQANVGFMPYALSNGADWSGSYLSAIKWYEISRSHKQLRMMILDLRWKHMAWYPVLHDASFMNTSAAYCVIIFAQGTVEAIFRDGICRKRNNCKLKFFYTDIACIYESCGKVQLFVELLLCLA